MDRQPVRIIITLCFSVLFYCACGKPPVPPPEPVQTGADQTALYLPQLKGKKVALVANHTSVIGSNHLADTLIKCGINLKKIFAPEHGFRGDADAGAEITNAWDAKTGIQVISLYGSRLKPDREDLKDIDIVIFDIQDVGVRFYTYISTLHYVMEACAENNVRLLVLDRPNPNGHYIDGPVLDTSFRSFVGMHPIPVVYGMTIGELARMISGEKWLSGDHTCDLQVISCRHYDHTTFYSLPVNPSPNLNCMEAIYLYPSICFFEGTVMSLGRGTTDPFRMIGHPDYPDHTFSFVPRSTPGNKNPLLKDRTCFGIDLRKLTVSNLQRSGTVDLHWLLDTYKRMPAGNAFFTDYFDKLAGSGELRKQILAGFTEAQIRQSWQGPLDEFRVIRKKYLLYEDFEKEL
jgi:uncharacterized protein YbbC (DUF1343 family)